MYVIEIVNNDAQGLFNEPIIMIPISGGSSQNI
jgi:hypothetical protein